MNQRVGIFGANNLGRKFMTVVPRVENWQVSGFHDADFVNTRSVIKDLGLSYYESFDELTKNSDTLVFAGSHSEIEKLVSKAIRSGKNIILPYYNLFTQTQLQNFSRVAAEAETVVFCGSAGFYNSALNGARNYLNEPVFIDVARLQQYSVTSTKLSLLDDLLIKDVDWVMDMVRSNVKRVSVNPVSVMHHDGPDFINVKLEFDNGCIANLTASRISELNLRKSRIYQEKSVLYVDLLNQELKRSTKKGNVVDFEDIQIEKKNDVEELLQAFNAALKKERANFINFNQAITHQNIMELITDKMKLKSTFL